LCPRGGAERGSTTTPLLSDSIIPARNRQETVIATPAYDREDRTPQLPEMLSAQVEQ